MTTMEPRSEPRSIFERWADVEVRIVSAPEQPPPGELLERLSDVDGPPSPEVPGDPVD